MPPRASAQQLREIKTFPALVKYLHAELEWPIETDDFDELTFEYRPDELGLKQADAARVKKIHQLRPLESGQPWGIFFVEFEKKKLPVVVLRRILSHLVVKRRASANKGERAAWHADDLLFVSAFGAEAAGTREIAFAHFHQEGGDLPTLRVLGWDGGDTPLKLENVAETLREKLHWPAKPDDHAAWRQQWAGAFRHRLGHVIRTADLLAEALAQLARGIRDAAGVLLSHESAKGPLTRLFKAFKSALIHDLTEETFADTYAQTITYGLLTAAISRTERSEGRHGTALIATNVTDMVPITNPFLKEMLQEFLAAGGRKGGIDFDELGIQDVVELLRGDETDLPAILRDFGNKTRGEDPVIHFYEHFLSAYNRELKIQRGVFYTPQPVVSYIVRSVHELLQTEFGLADGLADTTTWGEMLKKHPGLKLPPLTDEPGEKHTISPDEPFVQILDPATGTATFLVEVIDVIHRTLAAKWKQQRLSDVQQRDAWNDYVPRHLLPRLHAYELMMAPYAIAHMKIGLKLEATGYRFGAEERARIYLTNALEPWVKQLQLIGFDALAHEAAAVNEIKRQKRFTVVIGNPPYSSSSQNTESWAMRLIEDYKITVRDAETQIQALSDDYVKFIRFGQFCLENSKCGVLGYITNNNFQSATTFRDMRGSLSRAFNWMRLIDLHGNSRLKEQSSNGALDKNVFDILPGVCVSLLAASPKATLSRARADLLGPREVKYDWLTARTISTTETVSFAAAAPQYSFLTVEATLELEYGQGMFLPELFGSGDYQKDKTTWYGSGFKTQQDEFAIGFTRAEIKENVQYLLAPATTENSLRSRFVMCGTAQWSFSLARKELRVVDWESLICPCVYRPFDVRFTVLHRGVVSNPRTQVMTQLLRPNLGLCVGRQGQAIPGTWNIVFITRFPEDQNLFYRGGNTIFPLYWYSDSGELGLGIHNSTNLSRVFLERIATTLSLQRSRDTGLPAGLPPEDIVYYAYAVLHSPGYRRRYAEFLKIDFPRLPLTGNLELFRMLARLGGELTALHLLESPKLDKPITEFVGTAKDVTKVGYSDNTVWINAGGTRSSVTAGTSGFRGVSEAVWNFHIGGYQVCEKWLKDRKSRKLSKDDITHYQKIVVALSETIRLMADIDRVINEHGGWPGAFSPKVSQ